MQLRPYQERLVTGLAKQLSSGKRKVVGQLATGGGKTISFAAIAQRYTSKSQKPVLILVHRQELLQQTFNTLYKAYGIIATIIDVDAKKIGNAPVYVGMCETVNRRMQNNPNYLPEIGLLITDECHIGNFSKLYDFFPSAYIIGFTATPLSAKKSDPLKNYFDEIVVGVDIHELIELWREDNTVGLVPNKTYSTKNSVERSSLVVKGNDYDESQMAFEYSKAKHVQNTVTVYQQHAEGSKAMVFNCNVEHSKLVTEAFLSAGYDCRHVDANSENRKAIFKWFKETPGAILCNVGIATTGFDEPTVETIIVNRSTMSLPLWLQMTGRGSRPYEGKTHFTILDLGNNAATHGDWSDPRDWHHIFHNPPKPREKQGVAPVKSCPECELILPVQAKTCPECGYAFPVKETEYDKAVVELQLITKNLNVEELVQRNSGYKDYYTLFQIGNNIATQAKYKVQEITDDVFISLLTVYNEKAKEWCKIKGKRFNNWHQDTVKTHLSSQLSKVFPSWQMPL
jgi:superfamily II DNA or RNA helicase